jgi:hypothetical protein
MSVCRAQTTAKVKGIDALQMMVEMECIHIDV